MALLPFVAVAYFVLYVLARTVPVGQQAGQQPLLHELHQEVTKLGPQLSLSAWIDWEEKIALGKLLNNVAPGGSNTQGAAPGTVIASPSVESPNYYFQWIRDAGITLHTLVDIYEVNPVTQLANYTIFPTIESYIGLSKRIQHTSNPSGNFEDLSGLGEPKFMVDGTPFTGAWGRPQRDGPALRAITLMKYLRAYNASHPYLWTSDQNRNPYADLYDAKLPTKSVIKADLEYVAKYWSQDGFDLWEEVQGLHYFTAAVQLRALREGVDIAVAFNDLGAASFYEAQAKELENLIQRFWDGPKNHLVASLGSQRSGLDCALLLGALHGNPTGKVGGFAPYSDEILASLLAFVKDQRNRYPINMIPSQNGKVDDLTGVGIGRYPEDVYDGYGNSPNGGNPWFLCTASVAEVLFRTASHLQTSQALTVTERGSPFWATLSQSEKVKPGYTYLPSDPLFKTAIHRLQELADEYLVVIQTHTSGEGSMSEQFDRYTGFERGARDLTWSYGAFLAAIAARKETLGRN